MPGSSDRDILNLEEAAKLLGVSVKTFNKVLHSESIPARKIGREWKFSRQALIDWVGDGRSDQFYRETTSTRVALGPQSEQDERRTSGWSLSPE
ncbi:MAG: excisionase family DNA binding protein [Planctomycetota bacterium]|jgi:excisionase family DNA binding protein